jgi:hypothetical protein
MMASSLLKSTRVGAKGSAPAREDEDGGRAMSGWVSSFWQQIGKKTAQSPELCFQ